MSSAAMYASAASIVPLYPHGGREAEQSSPVADDGPIDTGVVQGRILAGDPPLRYHLYVPSGGGEGTRLLVAVHGISRNAEEQARRFARRAERYGVTLVAPLFDAERFPDYQRVGRLGRGERADWALERIVAEVGRLTGACTERLYLFGFSGGGQFVHRYAMAYPERVAAMAIGAAGWYTFPDPRRRYPRGIRPSAQLPGVRLDPARFLRIPTSVLVGEHDNERDPQVRQTRRVDRQQGEHRIDRGQRWVAAMRGAALARGLDTVYTFEVLPDSDHSFTRCMRRGRLGRRVFRRLFGRAPARVVAHRPGATMTTARDAA